MKEFARRLHLLRKKSKLSQGEIGNLVGVNRAVVTNWERGRNTPSLPNLVTLARVLDTTLDYLVGESKVENARATEPKVSVDTPTLALQDARSALERLSQLLPAGATEAEATEWRSVDILGTISASEPEAAGDVWLGTVAVPARWLPRRQDGFAIRVNGESMAPVLEHGDIVVVRRQTDVRPGQIVVAMRSGEPLVKWLERKGTGYQLQPEAHGYPVVRVDEHTQIMGRVVGLLRDLRRRQRSNPSSK